MITHTLKKWHQFLISSFSVTASTHTQTCIQMPSKTFCSATMSVCMLIKN